MSRTGVFCGGAGGSAEHVLPRWLKTAFNLQDLDRGLHIRMNENSARTHEQGLLHSTAKVVCTRCNNDWMNDLEASVRPFLPGMINGVRTDLSPDHQRALAAWSLKTMFMLRHTHPATPQVIPPEDYRTFYEERTPSHLMIARIGYIDVISHGTVELAAEFMCPAYGESAYLGTLRLGHFLVQILRGPGLPVGQAIRPFADTTHLTAIWPTTEARSWPPEEVIASSQFDLLAHPEPLPIEIQATRQAAGPTLP